MAVPTTIFSPDPKALQGDRQRIEPIAPRLLPPPVQAKKSLRVFGQQEVLVEVPGRIPEAAFAAPYEKLQGQPGTGRAGRTCEIGSQARAGMTEPDSTPSEFNEVTG